MIVTLLTYFKTSGLVLVFLLGFVFLENAIRPVIETGHSRYAAFEGRETDYCISQELVLRSFLISDKRNPDEARVTTTQSGLLVMEGPLRTQLLLEGAAAPPGPRPIEPDRTFRGYRFWQGTKAESYGTTLHARTYNERDIQLAISANLSASFMTRLDARKEKKQLSHFIREIQKNITVCPQANLSQTRQEP